MRIAVVGAGGIGGIFAAALAEAGAEISLVARGPHLAAVREHGLRIEGDRGETQVRPAAATDDPASIGPVDIVLVCTKLWDVETAGEQIRPLIGPGTAVVPLQNGVDAHERLIPIVGPASVMGGTAFVTGSIVAPGVIRQTGTYQRMTFGELDGSDSARGRGLAEWCDKAGFEGVFSPDVRVPMWDKFVMLVPMSGLNALTRLPFGTWRETPELVELCDAALRETVAVGRAEGVNLAPDAVETGRRVIAAMPPHHMTSMGNDLLRGNRLELPWFAGKVVELGRKHAVPTPANGFIYAALKPYVNGTPV